VKADRGLVDREETRAIRVRFILRRRHPRVNECRRRVAHQFL